MEQWARETMDSKGSDKEVGEGIRFYDCGTVGQLGGTVRQAEPIKSPNL